MTFKSYAEEAAVWTVALGLLALTGLGMLALAILAFIAANARAVLICATLIIIAWIVAGCAGPLGPQWRSVYPASHPAGGMGQAFEVCQAKAAAAPGFGAIDGAIRRDAALRACMMEFGYRDR